MHARVITSKADPGLIDQWIGLTQRLLIPASKALKGFAGYIAFYERESGTSVAVTLWEDECSERASDLASTESREAFAKAVGADLRVDHYEVAAIELR